MGAGIPDSVRAIVGARRGGAGRSEPRRIERAGVVGWHWPGGWAPGSEEALPLDHAGWTGSGVVRLDDRDALTGALLDAAGPGATDDATLAWRSFAAWGDRAPGRWLGDYALATVSPARDRLIVARGITGVRACFHTTIGALECVSDDPGLLTRLRPDERNVRTEAVAEYLRHGQLVSPTLTFHREVTRIPAAHTLLVTRDGAHRLTRHWDHPMPEPRFGLSEDEVAEEFHEVLGRAVRDRLRAPKTALLLSGGLDSPALAVVARRASPTVGIHACTISWSRLLADPEVSFARQVAERLGLGLEVIERSPEEGLGAPAPFTTPEPMPAIEPGLWRSQSAMLAARAPVVLNGEGADAILRPTPLLTQIGADGLMRTVSAWRAYRQAFGARPWIGLRTSLGLRGRAHRSLTEAPAWLRPEVAERLPVERDPRVKHPRAGAVRALLDPTWDAACWLDDPVMSGADVVVLLPFMDPRVIRFCFSLPVVPWLQRKFLLRRALRGHLPDAVLERPKSPLRGFDAARVRIWRAIGAPAPLPASVAEWVDLDAWRHALADQDDARGVCAAWRVNELSRWLAQPGGGE